MSGESFIRFFARIFLLLTIEVLEVGGVEVVVCKEGKCSKNFVRNIFTFVNGKFGGSRSGGLPGRESFMRFLAGIFLLLESTIF